MTIIDLHSQSSCSTDNERLTGRRKRRRDQPSPTIGDTFFQNRTRSTTGHATDLGNANGGANESDCRNNNNGNGNNNGGADGRIMATTAEVPMDESLLVATAAEVQMKATVATTTMATATTMEVPMDESWQHQRRCRWTNQRSWQQQQRRCK